MERERVVAHEAATHHVDETVGGHAPETHAVVQLHEGVRPVEHYYSEHHDLLSDEPLYHDYGSYRGGFGESKHTEIPLSFDASIPFLS